MCIDLYTRICVFKYSYTQHTQQHLIVSLARSLQPLVRERDIRCVCACLRMRDACFLPCMHARVFVCVSICVCTCGWVCIFMCVHECTCVCVFPCVHVHVCACVRVCICTHTCLHTYTRMHTRVYARTYMCVSTHQLPRYHKVFCQTSIF